MDKENKSLIERAITLFNKGRFAEAKTLYEKADEIYGNSLFRINIELCDKRISKSEYFSQARQEILNIAESINSSRLTSR
jgi:tetratricopeptide (TPR) repeat protein